MTEVNLNDPDELRDLAHDYLCEARGLRSDAEELEGEAHELLKKARELDEEP